ncbi:MAG: glycosyltransferase family 4 protein [Planctomycetes bacterium]|nr:glycosyltransferase family 4 protein [Planctomycetota bacterium]
MTSLLHLFSNFKWTGPAEPALELALGLQRAGWPITFRSSAFTKDSPHNFVYEKGVERGLVPVLDLALGKHRSPLRDRRDVKALERIFADERPLLVHGHLPNATRLACRAVRRAKTARPIIVQSCYETMPERLSRLDVALAKRTAATFVYSRRVLEAFVRRGVDDARLIALDPSIDLERFAPGDGGIAFRERMGFASDDFVCGIVARVQRHRFFDVLLDTVERVAKTLPTFRLVVIGRGTHLEDTLVRPARERGLLDTHVFTSGYLEGGDYVHALRGLDAKVFLVPGTDGTARAVREALAVGLPVVTTTRGILPELVADGRTGFVRASDPDALADAIVTLGRDRDLRSRMARAARVEAEQRFDLARQVERVVEVYARLGVPS